MQKNILWLDTETTGLDVKLHGLREVAVILETEKRVKQKNLFINTNSYIKRKSISEYVAIEMGVTDDLLSAYPDSIHQFKEFITFLEKNQKNDETYMLAGYNIEFDIKFLKDWFYDNNSADYKKYFSHQTLDLLPVARFLNVAGVINTKNNQLKTVCNYFGIELNPHNALDDIIATKELFDKIVLRTKLD